MPAVFVHVSDIHFGQERAHIVHIHDDVKRELIADATAVVAVLPSGCTQGIQVSGDIAYSGKAEQYESAGKWLDDLAGGIRCPIHRVQMVPGNHDLDRDRLSSGGEQLLDYIRAGGPAEYEKVIANENDRATLFSRFEDYGRFCMGYNCGLDEEAKHPPNWYKDADQVRKYVRSRARVFISGHEHNPKVAIDKVGEDCDVMMLAAGAAVPFKSNEIYTYTYNIIEFDWDAEMDALAVTMLPRAWNPTDTCFEADDKRLGGKEPRITLGSPEFRKVGTTGPLDAGKLVDVPAAAATPPATAEGPAVDMVAAEGADVENEEGVPMPPPDAEGYELALLRFFRDLYESERLRLLVGLDAIPPEFDGRMNQGVERRLFDMLARDSKVPDMTAMIDALIAERKERDA